MTPESKAWQSSIAIAETARKSRMIAPWLTSARRSKSARNKPDGVLASRRFAPIATEKTKAGNKKLTNKMKDAIISELEANLDDEYFEDLKEKLECLLLEDFRNASSVRECSLCAIHGHQGRLIDECTGQDWGGCEHCKGVGFLPIA